MALSDGTIRATATLRLVLIIVLLNLSLLVKTSVHCGSSVADSYPVVIEDGTDNYLILDDDEVANNSQLLKFLSQTSKEDLEEIVDSNPRLQDAILNKIKGAIDNKVKSKVVTASDSTKPLQASSETKQAAPIGVPKGQAVLVHGQEEDSDEYDEESDIDDERIVMWRSKIKNGATKMFKIGAGVRDKVLEIYNKRNKKKKPSKRPKTKLTWPHFHYKISTN